MWFGLITLFPEMIQDAMRWGVVARGVTDGHLQFDCFNPRDFAQDKHATVDAKPYGGSPGMLLQNATLQAALDAASARSVALGLATELSASSEPGDLGQQRPPVIYLSPQGQQLDQSLVQRLSQASGCILLCGRYEGVDERLVRRAVDMEISVGDYVVSGGELPALTLIDAIARCLPGVLGNSASIERESHLDGLLDYPQYTRPEIYGTDVVPRVLLSGDHGAIQRWQSEQALLRTWLRRPDLLAHRSLSAVEREQLAAVLADWNDDKIY